MGLVTNRDFKFNMSSELRLELRSSNSVAILMSFVKQRGMKILADELELLRQRNVEVRLLTTVYTGATDQGALDFLVNDLGVNVRINYNADQSHLHAKAWLFNRNSGYSTAFVGSSNLSGTALTDGLEWNVRLSEISSGGLLGNFRDAFNSYWESDIFEPYDPKTDSEKLQGALSFARNKFGNKSGPSQTLFMPNVDVEARPHQEKMLEDLKTQRDEFGRHRNLVVAATGTGKTVLAALDYSALQDSLGKKPSLLFVAHRQEILDQSLITFRTVLKDSNFGEKLVGGHRPEGWRHVFASIQSLTSLGLEKLDPTQFDYVVIDEFHHASASSYEKLISFLRPKELLGLTATPERGDGKRVQDQFFDGVIASELRLWDALDRQLLAPFDYYGIAEQTDFTNIEWQNNHYNKDQLENKVIRNDLRDLLVIKQIQKNILNPLSMKALVFCVGVKHAHYVGELLESRGLKAKVLTGDSFEADRAQATRQLSDGAIQAIVTVDIFNEGVDIPQVDSIIMLRPTESPVIFLQQLGRGLRRDPSKESVTVLDFVGSHRHEFRMDKKYEALTGLLPGQLVRQINEGFPNLPGGMTINLEPQAAELVIDNIKAQLNYGSSRLVSLATKANTSSLTKFLEDTQLDLWELYARTSWLSLKVEASLEGPDDLPENSIPLSRKGSKFLHIDDYTRIRAYTAILKGEERVDGLSASQFTSFKRMLFWSLFPDAKLPNGKIANSYEQAFQVLRTYELVISEWLDLLKMVGDRATAPTQKIDFKVKPLALLAHASYTRDEILGATGWGRLPGSDSDKSRKTKGHQVGVSYLEELDLDIFFINLNKDEKNFTETTRYKDFARTREIFHWESQNKDSEESKDGRRYISQPSTKHDVLLCVRERSDGSAFRILGLADYEKHTGSKPLQIDWKLRTPLDIATFETAAAFKVS